MEELHINENGVDRLATPEEIVEYKKMCEEWAEYERTRPRTPKERLDKVEPTLEIMQKGLADLGNLIGKLMRGGGIK